MVTIATAQNRCGSGAADDCCAKNKKIAFQCKLTTPEFQQRKATVIQSLKNQLLEKKELKNGFAYKFSGSDNIVAELNDFIKTERECCDFFVFNLSVKEDKSEAWLQITGPKGVKEFMQSELEM